MADAVGAEQAFFSTCGGPGMTPGCIWRIRRRRSRWHEHGMSIPMPLVP